jgi:putative FmdB family regulatory protein
MPIYAYRCATCGNAKDVLQKMSDPVLTVCPFCGASTFEKQVTAAGFQLKGSGWYVTDFRGDKKPASATPSESKAEGASGTAKSEGGKTEGAKSEAAAPAAAKSQTSASPAPAPAPAPSSSSSSDKK